MGHSVIYCDFCGNRVMEDHNSWECDCGAECSKYTDFRWKKLNENKCEKIVGDFDDALCYLINSLVRGKSHIKLCSDLLYEWDQRRGNDWYTSTKKKEQSNKYVVLCDASNYPSIVVFDTKTKALLFETLLKSGYQLWGTNFEPVEGKTCILELPSNIDIDGCNWLAESLEQYIKNGDFEGILEYGS